MKEIWKDIEGYNKIYQVSNLGRVRSLDRKIFNNGNGAWCNQKGKVLKPNTDSGGYPYVGLYDVNNIQQKTISYERFIRNINNCIFSSDIHNACNCIYYMEL